MTRRTPCVSTMAEVRRRLSRRSAEVHTLQRHPITGTPCEVPVPKKVSFIPTKLSIKNEKTKQPNLSADPARQEQGQIRCCGTFGVRRNILFVLRRTLLSRNRNRRSSLPGPGAVAQSTSQTTKRFTTLRRSERRGRPLINERPKPYVHKKTRCRSNAFRENAKNSSQPTGPRNGGPMPDRPFAKTRPRCSSRRRGNPACGWPRPSCGRRRARRRAANRR